jgi:hypothetical protein
VSVKNDNQKEAFIRTMIELYLSNTTDANALFAMLVAYDKVTKGSGAMSGYELAKIISEIFKHQVNIADSYHFVSEQWNKT